MPVFAGGPGGDAGDDPAKPRTVGDIVSKFAYWKNRIQWRLTKDLKPRVIIGMKADSTPIDIHNATGFPRVDTFNRGILKKGSHNKADGTEAYLDVPLEKAWNVRAVQCTFLCDATVANRVCFLLIPQFGLGGIAGAAPGSLVSTALTISLTASQYGYMNQIGARGTRHSWKNINGTGGGIPDSNLVPFWMGPGGHIAAKITSNAQATDKSGIDILYEEYDLET